jgi:hypothetical protein
LRINGSTGRDNTGSTWLRDGGKNAVQRGLKTNHLALHDLIKCDKGEEEWREGWTYDILAFQAGQTSMRWEEEKCEKEKRRKGIW